MKRWLSRARFEMLDRELYFRGSQGAADERNETGVDPYRAGRSKPMRPMSRMLRLLVLVSAIFLAASLPADIAIARAIGAVSVAGRMLTADGRPWIPRGVNVVGLVSPRPARFRPVYAAAAARWGSAEVAAIKAYGADLVRFQVSQPGLDPESPLYTPAYQGRIAEAVRLVRSAGMAAIVSMQWERPSGLGQQSPMPDASTFRAWGVLAPIFGRDPGVMYELFNEPRIPRRAGLSLPQQWATWTAVFQRLIDNVRAISHENVIVVDGLRQRINPPAANSLTDPAGRLAFAVHPYPRFPEENTPQAWNAAFGDVALTHPVILTEWNATSRRIFCTSDTPQLAQTFLAYIHQRRIGLVGWAFDMPGSLVKDLSFTPTDYVDFRCGPDGDNGAGEVLRRYFLSEPRR